MRYLSSISLALIVLMALACSSTDIEATVEARLAQERGIEATVQARLAEERAAQPTSIPTATNIPSPTATPAPTPTLTPTPEPTLSAQARHLIGLAGTKASPTQTPWPTATPVPCPGLTLGFGEVDYYRRGRDFEEDGHALTSKSLQLSMRYFGCALEDFNTAILLEPRYMLAYYYRGNTHGTLGQRQLQLDDYNMAIILNPDWGPPYFMRAGIYDILGQYDKAKADWAKVCEIEGKNDGPDWDGTSVKTVIGATLSFCN